LDTPSYSCVLRQTEFLLFHLEWISFAPAELFVEFGGK